jgi:hypothetical protein
MKMEESVPKRRHIKFSLLEITQKKTYSVYLYRQVGVVILHLPAYEDKTECSETSAYKILTPGNYPE